jgi:quinol monooxygenase YgiN
MSAKRWWFALLVPALLGLPGPSRAQSDQQQYVVIYVEVQPQQTNRARQLLDDLASASRQSPGVVNFSVGQQVGRLSLFTLVERWDSADAYVAYKASPTWTGFLAKIEPFLSAPLDERAGVLLE